MTHRPTTADVTQRFNDEKARREAADARIVALEAALREIAQAASAAADALAMHDPITRSRLAIQGRFEAIADLAQTALREDSHDD